MPRSPFTTSRPPPAVCREPASGGARRAAASRGRGPRGIEQVLIKYYVLDLSSSAGETRSHRLERGGEADGPDRRRPQFPGTGASEPPRPVSPPAPHRQSPLQSAATSAGDGRSHRRGSGPERRDRAWNRRGLARPVAGGERQRAPPGPPAGSP